MLEDGKKRKEIEALEIKAELEVVMIHRYDGWLDEYLEIDISVDIYDGGEIFMII